MNSYFSIEPDRIKSLDDYVSTIGSEIKKQAIVTMFNVATKIFARINARYGTNFDHPIIRISSNQSPDAQGMEGMIEISEGLINYCLATQFENFNEIMGEDAPVVELDSGMVAQASLIWVMSHEYFHIVGRHNEVLLQYGSEEDTLHAIERDADLCAIAELFRINQWCFGADMSTSQIRRLTLYLTFWAIRTFPYSSEQSTHPSSAVRLWYIIGKLAIVTEVDGPNQNPDASCKLPQTLENVRELTECLVNCENAFQKIHGADDFGSLFPELKSILDNGAGRHAVRKWDEIKRNVSQSSTS